KAQTNNKIIPINGNPAKNMYNAYFPGVKGVRSIPRYLSFSKFSILFLLLNYLFSNAYKAKLTNQWLSIYESLFIISLKDWLKCLSPKVFKCFKSSCLFAKS